MEDDLFGAVHNAEEQSIQQGRQDGIREGLVTGLLEGRELGLQKGYEMGHEVGFYSGCVQVWRQLQRADPTFMPERLEKGVAALEEILAALPMHNPQDEALHDALERLRSRFKVVASGLGCMQHYFPKDTSAEGLAF